jgi:hypothetical protein
MVLYYCKYCNKPFTNKSDYERHIKSHENNTIHTPQVHIAPTERLVCVYCKKTFLNAKTLQTHTETKCKQSPAQNMREQAMYLNIKLAKMEAKQKEMEQRQKLFETKILNQDQKLDTVIDAVNNIETGPLNGPNITINNPNITVNNPTINILHMKEGTLFYINNIKEEKSIFEMLSDEQLNHILQLGGDSISKLIEYKHYNKDFPENHNLYITKQKADIAKVFIDSRFIDVDINELLDYLIQKSQNEITEILKLGIFKLDYKKQRHLYNLQLKIKENAPATISMLKEELRKLMKNNAELVISTFRHMQANMPQIANETGNDNVTFIDV